MATAWGVLPIAFISTWFLYWLSLQAPSREDDGDVGLSFPSDLESLKAVARALQLYSERNWWYGLILFGSAYTYKQTFCIPGSGILNILAGALYGPVGGLIFVCIFTATGATLAYLISKTFYRQIIHKLFPDRFRSIEAKIIENRDKLFYFMIFIRVVPISPGWAINLIAPLVNVPIHIFFVTTLIGLIPYNFLGVSAGGMITSLSSVHDIFSWKTFLLLFCMAVAVLIPTLLSKKKNAAKIVKNLRL